MAIAGLVRGRRTQLAAETERKIRALLVQLGQPERASAQGYSRREPGETPVEVFADGEIEPQRERMILRAEDSIYLSSLTPPGERLAVLLMTQVRKGLRVILIIAERTIKTREQEDRLDRLKDAGVVCRYLRSTHSKCLVVDQEYVMNGSANAHRVNRDVCDVWRDPVQARKIINHLNGLR